jgi:hypothetical protein
MIAVLIPKSTIVFGTEMSNEKKSTSFGVSMQTGFGSLLVLQATGKAVATLSFGSAGSGPAVQSAFVIRQGKKESKQSGQKERSCYVVPVDGGIFVIR